MGRSPGARVRACLLPALLGVAVPAGAGDLSSVGELTQDEFRSLVRDLGAAISYKGVIPATPLGTLGLDVGVELTQASVENSRLFAIAGAGEQSQLFVPKLHVHKGLPFNLDVSGFAAVVPDLDASLYGFGLRWAVVDDGLTTPAVGLRLAGTWASGLGGLKANTASADVLVSKRFTALTPYAGIGTVRTEGSPSVEGLRDERVNQGRVFGGLNVNLVAMNLAFEAEKMGDNVSLSAKLGWRF